MASAPVRRAAAGVLLAAAACARHRVADGARAPAAAAGCAAVAAALDSLVPRRAGYRLALADSTRPVPSFVLADSTAHALRRTPGLDPSTWASFAANNRARRPACTSLAAGDAVVVTDSTARALRGQRGGPNGYWDAFYARYPRTAGFTATSGVGVSRDGRQALLVVEHGCGALCGHGHVVLLGRGSDGVWRVRYARMTWAS
jgi:hypothetical protein